MIVTHFSSIACKLIKVRLKTIFNKNNFLRVIHEAFRAKCLWHRVSFQESYMFKHSNIFSNIFFFVLVINGEEFQTSSKMLEQDYNKDPG